jgi:hypothetical protein
MCTDAASDSLNALHKVDDKADAPVITLQFGPYMN